MIVVFLLITSANIMPLQTFSSIRECKDAWFKVGTFYHDSIQVKYNCVEMDKKLYETVLLKKAQEK